MINTIKAWFGIGVHAEMCADFERQKELSKHYSELKYPTVEKENQPTYKVGDPVHLYVSLTGRTIISICETSATRSITKGTVVDVDSHQHTQYLIEKCNGVRDWSKYPDFKTKLNIVRAERYTTYVYLVEKEDLTREWIIG